MPTRCVLDQFGCASSAVFILEGSVCDVRYEEARESALNVQNGAQRRQITLPTQLWVAHPFPPKLGESLSHRSIYPISSMRAGIA